MPSHFSIDRHCHRDDVHHCRRLERSSEDDRRSCARCRPAPTVRSASSRASRTRRRRSAICAGRSRSRRPRGRASATPPQLGRQCMQGPIFGDITFPQPAERGLPQPQRVDAGDAVGAAAGDGVDPRRRLPGGRRTRAAPRRRSVRPQGRRPRDPELSPRRVRVHGASGPDARVRPQRVGQLRHARSGRRAPAGSRTTSRRSAAIPATSPSSASPPGRSRSAR